MFEIACPKEIFETLWPDPKLNETFLNWAKITLQPGWYIKDSWNPKLIVGTQDCVTAFALAWFGSPVSSGDNFSLTSISQIINE